MPIIVPDIPAAEIAIIELTNAFRAQHKRAAVSIDPTLSEAARRYARFLAQSQLFSHTADGQRSSDRVKAAGYNACQVAENLAMFLDSRGFETRQLATKMVEGWKNSPGHRRNMMIPNVTQIGIGIAKASNSESYYSVQLFARPARLKYRFEVQNRSNVVIPFQFAGKRHKIKPRYAIRLTACQPGSIRFALPKRRAKIFEPKDGSVFTVKRRRGQKLIVITGTLGRVKLSHKRQPIKATK